MAAQPNSDIRHARPNKAIVLFQLLMGRHRSDAFISIDLQFHFVIEFAIADI
jgi:hypothetical protein